MENITVKDDRMYSLIFLYDLHTKLFNNVIEGISDEDANNRMNTKANHVAWIAGSVVNGRFELARVAGVDIKQTSAEIFQGHKPIQEGTKYPSLEEYKNDWKSISGAFRDALVNLTTEQLNADDPFGMSGEEEKLTFYHTIAFIVDRESYCIGQIGLYRRLLGYEAMKY